ncbi:hypothetical protein WA158_003217 [Blastocystis sp. Blastoise]
MSHFSVLSTYFFDNILIYYILTPLLYVLLFPIYVYEYVCNLLYPEYAEEPKSVLITGASSGIGEAMAYYYAKKGADRLYIFGQNEERLMATKEGCLKLNPSMTVNTYVGNICNTEEFKARIESIKNNDQVDLVVANAGRCVFPELTSASLEDDYEKVFKLNIDATIQTCLPFIDQMKERHSGQFCIVSSIDGYGNGFFIPSYEATKNCCRIYFENLRHKLRPFGIHVNIVSPGPVNTRFTENQANYPGVVSSEKAAEIIGQQLYWDVPFISFPRFWHIFFFTYARQIPREIVMAISKMSQAKQLKKQNKTKSE